MAINGWRETDRHEARSQGWDIFDIAPIGVQIQRLSDRTIWEAAGFAPDREWQTDSDVWRHVCEQGLSGADTPDAWLCRRALDVIQAENPDEYGAMMRFNAETEWRQREYGEPQPPWPPAAAPHGDVGGEGVMQSRRRQQQEDALVSELGFDPRWPEGINAEGFTVSQSDLQSWTVEVTEPAELDGVLRAIDREIRLGSGQNVPLVWNESAASGQGDYEGGTPIDDQWRQVYNQVGSDLIRAGWTMTGGEWHEPSYPREPDGDWGEWAQRTQDPTQVEAALRYVQYRDAQEERYDDGLRQSIAWLGVEDQVRQDLANGGWRKPAGEDGEWVRLSEEAVLAENGLLPQTPDSQAWNVWAANMGDPVEVGEAFGHINEKIQEARYQEGDAWSLQDSLAAGSRAEVWSNVRDGLADNLRARGWEYDGVDGWSAPDVELGVEPVDAVYGQTTEAAARSLRGRMDGRETLSSLSVEDRERLGQQFSSMSDNEWREWADRAVDESTPWSVGESERAYGIDYLEMEVAKEDAANYSKLRVDQTHGWRQLLGEVQQQMGEAPGPVDARDAVNIEGFSRMGTTMPRPADRDAPGTRVHYRERVHEPINVGKPPSGQRPTTNSIEGTWWSKLPDTTVVDKAWRQVSHELPDSDLFDLVERADGDTRFALWLYLADEHRENLPSTPTHLDGADWRGIYKRGMSPAEGTEAAWTEAQQHENDPVLDLGPADRGLAI